MRLPMFGKDVDQSVNNIIALYPYLSKETEGWARHMLSTISLTKSIDDDLHEIRVRLEMENQANKDHNFTYGGS